MTSPTPPSWVEGALALQGQGRIDDAIDSIFDNFNSLHHGGKFVESDAALHLPGRLCATRYHGHP